jgi:hypothetical protein
VMSPQAPPSAWPAPGSYAASPHCCCATGCSGAGRVVRRVDG